jgi:hypothetical protein
MHTYTLKSWSVEGEKRWKSSEARILSGVQNRGTWNDYLISIGLPTGENSPVLTMTDLIWVQVAKLWMGQNARKSKVSTHQTFRILRWHKDWKLDDFLDYLNTDLLTITSELQRKINHG